MFLFYLHYSPLWEIPSAYDGEEKQFINHSFEHSFPNGSMILANLGLSSFGTLLSDLH